MRHAAMAIMVMIVLVGFVGSGNAGILQEVEVGIGPNFGYLDYDEPAEIWDAGWAPGFTAGVGIDISLSKQLSLAPYLRFSTLTNTVEFRDPDVTGEYQVNHKFISLPIMLRYELNENMFFVDLGPEFSLFLSSELVSDYVALGIPTNETIDIADNVESYNIGACIRVGFKAYRWNIPIAVTASYHHGFKGVAMEDEWLSDWKTREIALSVSYLFDLSK